MSRDIWKSWGVQGHPGLHRTCAEACIPSARNTVPLVIETNTPSTQVPERHWGRCCFQRHALCSLMPHWLRQPPAKPSSGLPRGGDWEVPTRWIWLPGQPPGPRPCPGEAPGSAPASAPWLAAILSPPRVASGLPEPCRIGDRLVPVSSCTRLLIKGCPHQIPSPH